VRVETEFPGHEPSRILDLRRVPELARMIEDLGFDGIATAETKHDPFLPLALAASATERVALSTGVAIATRSYESMPILRRSEGATVRASNAA
jgi:alkanesulfonate monooxygenase SsuD/methylene tetrahydromethanopterin reductase-like flavin-dependent oxidoreductase (luciferase family)